MSRFSSKVEVSFEVQHENIVEGHMVAVTPKYYEGISENKPSMPITTHRSLALCSHAIVLSYRYDAGTSKLWNGWHLLCHAKDLRPLSHGVIVGLKRGIRILDDVRVLHAD